MTFLAIMQHGPAVTAAAGGGCRIFGRFRWSSPSSGSRGYSALTRPFKDPCLHLRGSSSTTPARRIINSSSGRIIRDDRNIVNRMNSTSTSVRKKTMWSTDGVRVRRRNNGGGRKLFKSTISSSETSATEAAETAVEAPTRKQLWRVFMNAYVCSGEMFFFVLLFRCFVVVETNELKEGFSFTGYKLTGRFAFFFSCSTLLIFF